MPNDMFSDNRRRTSAQRHPFTALTLFLLWKYRAPKVEPGGARGGAFTRIITVCMSLGHKVYWYLVRIKRTFFTPRHLFLFRAEVFCRASVRGARRPACTHGLSLDPGRRPWRVLWDLKGERTSKLTTGYVSAQPEPARTTQIPHNLRF